MKAMEAVLDFGFNELNVHRVYAETISENKSAIALCQKMGFRHEAEFIHNRFFNNRWWNTSIYALLATEVSHNEA